MEEKTHSEHTVSTGNARQVLGEGQDLPNAFGASAALSAAAPSAQGDALGHVQELCRAMQPVPFAHLVASLTPPRVTQPRAPCDPQQRGGVEVARSAPRRAHRMFRQDSMAVVPPPKTQTVKKTMRSVVLNIICRA